MEALERLQSVHTTLQLMQQYSLCSSQLSDDRFVADFFLFLIQTGSDAEEMKRRCDILSNRISKVSITFLQALVGEKCRPGVSGKSQGACEVPSTGCEHSILNSSLAVKSSALKKAADLHSSRILVADNIHEAKSQAHNSLPYNIHEHSLPSPSLVPLVGFRAMQRANTTLEDFCRSYFMFHAMDVCNPQHLFKCLPILSFVEAFIYQLDEENEEQLLSPTGDLQAETSRERYHNSSSQSMTGVGNQPFKELQEILANQGLLTKRIELELRDGMEYWRLEQALCKSVTNGGMITAKDVVKAIKLKSFDYRVLNLLLYSLTGQKVNEVHFSFLGVSELLVEISDDLYDYEDDVLKNSYNVLRMLVKVYGPIEAPRVLASIISEAERRYQYLLEGLEPNLLRQYQERCKEATNEGGGGSKHSFGSWTFPPIIVEEMEFRAQMHGT